MFAIWLESLRTAAHVLRTNRLRTFLTALTVAVGAGAIALMTSLAASAIATITSGIDAVGGRDLLLIYAHEPKDRRGLTNLELTVEDARALRARVPGAVALDHLIAQPGQTLVAGAKKMVVDLGIGASYPRYVNQHVAWGRDLPPDDPTSASRSLLIAEAVAKELFGSPEAALDRDVLLWSHRYRVVGVTAGAPTMGFNLGDLDATRGVFVGTEVMVKDEGVRSDGLAVLKLAPDADHDRARRFVAAILRERHHGVADFEMFDFGLFMEKWEAIFLGLRIITGIIAAVSLVIAGAGVSNVVLASVRQRVAEIGIRRALGASASDIRRQFLVESMLLSFVGGACGALGGALLALGIGAVASQAIPGWQGRVSVGATLVALVTAVLFGWVFGARPARKASRLDVVECLRGMEW
jgi:putative ABC transport system permease protein